MRFSNTNQVAAMTTITIFLPTAQLQASWLSPIVEQMANGDPEIALRKIAIVNWRTAVAQQFNVHSIPQVNVYDRNGRLTGPVLGANFEKVKSYVALAKANH